MRGLETIQSWLGPYQKPAVLNSFILAVVGLVAYAMLMSARGNGIGVFIAVLLALPGLLGRWASSPIFVLIFTSYLLFDTGFNGILSFLSFGSYRVYLNKIPLNIETLLLTIGILIYMIGHYRLYSMLTQITPKDPFPRRNFPVFTSSHARPPESVTTDEFIRALMTAGVCVVVGTILWFTIDFWGDYLRQKLVLSASEYRVLVLLFAFFGGTGFVWIFLSLWNWYHLTPSQARIALRDMNYFECHEDVYRIRLWQRRPKK